MSENFLIGSYARRNQNGVLMMEVDFEKQSFRVLHGAGGMCNPTYLCLDQSQTMVYTSDSFGPAGSVSVLKLGSEGFTLLGSRSSVAAGPCHVSIDPSGKFLAVSNYSGATPGGSVTMYRLDESGMPQFASLCCMEGSGPHPTRQRYPHVHSVWYLNGHALVCDLGSDRLCVYQLDERTGELVETNAGVEMEPGSGPRHIAWRRNDSRWIYVVGELDGYIRTYEYVDGRYVLRQKSDSLPAGTSVEDRYTNRTGAIKISEDGRYLFVTDRGVDGVTAFAIGEDHLLRLADICCISCPDPRDLELFGDDLLLAHQIGSALTAMHFDRGTEKLQVLDAMQLDMDIQPVCIVKMKK